MCSGFCSAWTVSILELLLNLALIWRTRTSTFSCCLRMKTTSCLSHCTTNPKIPRLQWPGHSCLLFAFLWLTPLDHPLPLTTPPHPHHSSYCFAWVISNTVTRKQWMSCVAGVTLLQAQMQPALFVGHSAQSIFQFFSWFMASVFSCTNLPSN